ncbi:MAG TPA: DUF3501 family protein [Candidatus Acidoferrales bacterium]|nr:DUF3501 family protein [Candidatus Acidoferrales bacterium]
MNLLRPADIRSAAYDEDRAEARGRLVELKELRRVELSAALTLVFENRETLVAAVEESIRASRPLNVEDAVVRAVEAFNQLAPEPGAVLATLYLEAADASELARMAGHHRGVERNLYLEVGGERVEALAAAADEDLEPPAAFVVSFPVSDVQRRAWQEGADVVVGVDHVSVSSRVQLSADQRWALAGDF